MEDEVLLGLVTMGREEALEALYDRYSRQVYSLAFSILRDQGAAEEVIQEVFLSVWRRAASFNAQRGRAATWLLSISHHRAIDALRRRRRTYAQDQVWDESMDQHFISDQGPSTDAIVMLREEGRQVREALGELPPEQREALILAYFGGYTQAEIAKWLKQPLGTVKTRMRLGLQKLRKALEPRLRVDS